MKSKIQIKLLFSLCFMLSPLNAFGISSNFNPEILKVGNSLPSAKLKSYQNSDVNINDLKGKIKIISIVPKLNTPVCDKQTHRFSESNKGLDKKVDIITLSTNTIEDQQNFAKEAKIDNIIFLSDNPTNQFGKKTGLLIEGLGILRRTVIVADENNIIRYIDFVPGGGLPNIKKALEAAKVLLPPSKTKS